MERADGKQQPFEAPDGRQPGDEIVASSLGNTTGRGIVELCRRNAQTEHAFSEPVMTDCSHREDRTPHLEVASGRVVKKKTKKKMEKLSYNYSVHLWPDCHVHILMSLLA
ncbi:unnamed protein product [Sphagnum compactum]